MTTKDLKKIKDEYNSYYSDYGRKAYLLKLRNNLHELLKEQSSKVNYSQNREFISLMTFSKLLKEETKELKLTEWTSSFFSKLSRILKNKTISNHFDKKEVSTYLKLINRSFGAQSVVSYMEYDDENLNLNIRFFDRKGYKLNTIVISKSDNKYIDNISDNMVMPLIPTMFREELDEVFQRYIEAKNKFGLYIGSGDNALVHVQNDHLNTGQFDTIKCRDTLGIFKTKLSVGRDLCPIFQLEENLLFCENENSNDDNNLFEYLVGNTDYRDTVMVKVEDLHPVFQEMIRKEYQKTITTGENDTASTNISEQQVEDIRSFVNGEDNLLSTLIYINKQLSLPKVLSNNLLDIINSNDDILKDITYSANEEVSTIHFNYQDGTTIDITDKEEEYNSELYIYKSHINRVIDTTKRLYNKYRIPFEKGKINLSELVNYAEKTLKHCNSELEIFDTLGELNINSLSLDSILENKQEASILLDRIDLDKGLSFVTLKNGIFNVELVLTEDIELKPIITVENSLINTNDNTFSKSNLDLYLTTNKSKILSDFQVDRQNFIDNFTPTNSNPKLITKAPNN